MLSKEDNELITNVEQGTPMGETFRRFWLLVNYFDWRCRAALRA